jgi:hypothetical protein
LLRARLCPIEIAVPKCPVEINPLRRARKRFAPEAAPAMFTLLLDADERRILEDLQMSDRQKYDPSLSFGRHVN